MVTLSKNFVSAMMTDGDSMNLSWQKYPDWIPRDFYGTIIEDLAFSQQWKR